MTIQENRKAEAVIAHYFRIGRYVAAIPLITNLLRQDPENTTALYQMAVVELSRENFQEARELCQEALRLGYNKIIGYHFIGWAFQQEGKLAEAEEAYLAALERDPLDGELIASYGGLMLEAGLYEKAFALLEMARKLKPNNEKVNQLLLDFYFAKDDKGMQQEFIRNVMETSADEVQNLTNIAMFHVLKGEFKEARECYRQAFLLNPEDRNILGLLEYYDTVSHPLYAPQRLIGKIDGPFVAWLSFIVITMLLVELNLPSLLSLFVIAYVFFALSTWITPLFFEPPPPTADAVEEGDS
ncbi:tetratricopeptide repeat protein [Bacillus sp. B-jedd]|uniref:tetratricopeptide repeat protein n=1 Tax=Bacillus sp. B-jedd TaxID=1476857 RepID=UPI0005156BE8|nr:tetratricopeptide repeat protein [Bacillus sp. B-jedd]CEG28731.1 Photosystem I assembly protein Ycf3 [Bacillus sp. B-jedd]